MKVDRGLYDPEDLQTFQAIRCGMEQAAGIAGNSSRSSETAVLNL